MHSVPLCDMRIPMRMYHLILILALCGLCCANEAQTPTADAGEPISGTITWECISGCQGGSPFTNYDVITIVTGYNVVLSRSSCTTCNTIEGLITGDSVRWTLGEYEFVPHTLNSRLVEYTGYPGIPDQVRVYQYTIVDSATADAGELIDATPTCDSVVSGCLGVCECILNVWSCCTNNECAESMPPRPCVS